MLMIGVYRRPNYLLAIIPFHNAFEKDKPVDFRTGMSYIKVTEESIIEKTYSYENLL